MQSNRMKILILSNFVVRGRSRQKRKTPEYVDLFAQVTNSHLFEMRRIELFLFLFSPPRAQDRVGSSSCTGACRYCRCVRPSIYFDQSWFEENGAKRDLTSTRVDQTEQIFQLSKRLSTNLFICDHGEPKIIDKSGKKQCRHRPIARLSTSILLLLRIQWRFRRWQRKKIMSTWRAKRRRWSWEIYCLDRRLVRIVSLKSSFASVWQRCQLCFSRWVTLHVFLIVKKQTYRTFFSFVSLETSTNASSRRWIGRNLSDWRRWSGNEIDRTDLQCVDVRRSLLSRRTGDNFRSIHRKGWRKRKFEPFQTFSSLQLEKALTILRSMKKDEYEGSTAELILRFFENLIYQPKEWISGAKLKLSEMKFPGEDEAFFLLLLLRHRSIDWFRNGHDDDGRV